MTSHSMIDANPSLIRALKTRVSEDDNNVNMTAHLKTSYGANFWSAIGSLLHVCHPHTL
ncbi:MAG: hypothetical protein ACRD8Z_19620 [Nitrososphaeraceae archaeon]